MQNCIPIKFFNLRWPFGILAFLRTQSPKFFDGTVFKNTIVGSFVAFLVNVYLSDLKKARTVIKVTNTPNALLDTGLNLFSARVRSEEITC